MTSDEDVFVAVVVNVNGESIVGTLFGGDDSPREFAPAVVFIPRGHIYRILTRGHRIEVAVVV